MSAGCKLPKSALLEIPQVSCFPAFQGMRWKAGQRTDSPMLLLLAGREGAVIKLGELVNPGIASAGCLGIRDCPPTRNRSQDRAHAHCQRPNGAGLYAEAAAGAPD